MRYEKVNQFTLPAGTLRVGCRHDQQDTTPAD